MLTDFLVGQSNLDSSSIEQILLPPKAHKLYTSTEDLRKTFVRQLEKESTRISDDIDAFVQSLQRLFEEIKKILVSKVMQCEFDLKESITTYTQLVDRFLKSTYNCLVEDKKKRHYYSMTNVYGKSQHDSMDGELVDMSHQRNNMEMVDRALKIIRNNRRSYSIIEATDTMDSFLRSDKSVYQRQQFRRVFGDFRDELIRQIEDMELFKDNNIVKKMNLSLSLNHSQLETNMTIEPNIYKPKEIVNRYFHSPQNRLNDSELNHSYSDNMHTENSMQTNERPLMQRISSNPLSNGLYRGKGSPDSFKNQMGNMGDSLYASKQRKELIEERERAFRSKTNRPMWQSKEIQPAAVDDNHSWRFLDSIKRNFFGGQ